MHGSVDAMMVSYRAMVAHRWRVTAIVVACLALGAALSAIVLPQYFSNAASTALSSVWVRGTNTVNGSTAASSDAPGGLKSGTAKPGDTVKWVVPYENKTNDLATVGLKSSISGGAYVAGSLQLPAIPNGAGNVSPQYTTDGTTWSNGTPPAASTGVGFTGTLLPSGTKQLSLKFPGPSGSVLSTSGGDAYNVAVKGNLIYAIYHHRSGPVVYCSKTDGTTCPGWPTNSNVQNWSSTPGAAIGTGTPFDGYSAWQGGTWISGNKLFWLTGLNSAASVGTGCLDLSTTTPTSCGYTVLATNQTVGFNNGAQVGSTAIKATNGSIYAVTVSAGKNVIVCVNPATGAACGSVSLNSGVTTPYTLGSATFGNYVFTSVQKTTSDAWQTYCYVAGGQLCTGSWPVTTSTSQAFAPTPFAPVLSTSGAVTGICTIFNGGGSATKCWNLSGTPIAQVYGSKAQYIASGNAAGDTLQLGTKVYGSLGNTVFCVDFAQWSGTGTVPDCAGFTPPSNRVNYTVRTAYDIAPNCLVATGDAGQITFFNAITGGGCTGVSGPTDMTVTPTTYYCGTGAAGFKGWGALTLPGLVAGTFTTASVTLKDQNGNVIPGFGGVAMMAGWSINLSSIPTTVTSITASVTINGINDPSGVTNGQVSITWNGDPVEMCFQTVAPPVSCDAAAPVRMFVTANVVTTASPSGDGPAGNSSGGDGSAAKQAAFLVQADDTQCSLKIKKTSGVQAADMGDKVDYAITVQNTGTQAYDKASWTDDLTDVLKETTFNGNQAATLGTVSYTAPVLGWSGALQPGQTATVTYSVTVKNPAKGDHSLVNTVVSPNRKNNCTSGSGDPDCTVIVTVKTKEVTWHKVDQSKNILTGSEWSFTPVDGSGKPTGPSVAVTDCVAVQVTQCTGVDKDPLGGVFRLDDLGVGTYQLVETKAPFGFKLDPTPIPVAITAASTTVAVADIVNKQQPVPAIPFTGGLGTDFLTLTGSGLFALVLGLGCWQLIRRRRTA